MSMIDSGLFSGREIESKTCEIAHRMGHEAGKLRFETARLRNHVQQAKKTPDLLSR